MQVNILTPIPEWLAWDQEAVGILAETGQRRIPIIPFCQKAHVLSKRVVCLSESMNLILLSFKPNSPHKARLSVKKEEKKGEGGEGLPLLYQRGKLVNIWNPYKNKLHKIVKYPTISCAIFTTWKEMYLNSLQKAASTNMENIHYILVLLNTSYILQYILIKKMCIYIHI